MMVWSLLLPLMMMIICVALSLTPARCSLAARTERGISILTCSMWRGEFCHDYLIALRHALFGAQLTSRRRRRRFSQNARTRVHVDEWIVRHVHVYMCMLFSIHTTRTHTRARAPHDPVKNLNQLHSLQSHACICIESSGCARQFHTTHRTGARERPYFVCASRFMAYAVLLFIHISRGFNETRN